MRWRLWTLLVLAIGIGVGCDDSNPAGPSDGPPAIGISGGGSGSSTPGAPDCPNNRGTLAAVVDGAVWTSTCVPATSWVAGVMTIVAQNQTEMLAVTVNAAVPGSYTGQIGGARGTLTRTADSASWTSGPAGTAAVVLTRLDLQGATGTFSFAATPIAGTPAAGTRNVTNGTFSVTF